VCVAWIFFRAASIHDALLIGIKLTAIPNEIVTLLGQISREGLGPLRVALDLNRWFIANEFPVFDLKAVLFYVILIVLMLIKESCVNAQGAVLADITHKNTVLRLAIYCALVCLILLNWNAGAAQFIYFMF
jgi:hypothetical protein